MTGYLDKLFNSGVIVTVGKLANGDHFASVDLPDYAATEHAPRLSEALRLLEARLELEVPIYIEENVQILPPAEGGATEARKR